MVENAAFIEIYDTIRALLSRAVRDDSMTRHQVGQLLCKAKAEGHVYGERAVERLAKSLVMPASTLYRYAAVAESWSTEELAALLARTTRSGDPLSWSHLVTLTCVVSRIERDRLVDRCLAEAWSVRDLARHIALREREPDDASTQSDAEGESLRIALLEGLQSASKATTQIGIFVEAFESRRVEGSGDGELLARTILAHEKLLQKVTDALDCLRRASPSSESRVEVSAPPSHRRNVSVA